MTRFYINPETGIVDGARYVESPNQDERGDKNEIKAVIVHAISLPPACFGGDAIERFFLNELPASEHEYFSEIAELKVSAHFLIDREGQVVQFVPITRRAWHAGVSSCFGRTDVNNFSVGIELEGCDDVPFTEPQYQALADLVATLRERYPSILPGGIFGHSDIAPGRKTDPGPSFDWNRFHALLENLVPG